MPLIYYDKAVENKLKALHPALMLDKEGDCYRMVREMKDGKPTFRWTEEQALRIALWYIEGYNSCSVVDEFEESISRYEFQRILEKSYYLDPDGQPSECTIKELYNAHLMEEKMREAEEAEREMEKEADDNQ